MKLTEKLKIKANDNYHASGVTIAFLGDSVTQGCFEIYKTGKESVETVFDQQYAYHKYFKDMLTYLYPSVPVNIINSGISGDHAPHGLERLENDVLRYNPDLTVVCYGLNDCTLGLDRINEYTTALKEIFKKLKEASSEIIFMTPNMMCDHVSCHITDEHLREIAQNISAMQNDNFLDTYINKAKEVCRENDIAVCDCYAKWKRLKKLGVDTTELLSNRINHPTREMNKLFAVSLLETIFENF